MTKKPDASLLMRKPCIHSGHLKVRDKKKKNKSRENYVHLCLSCLNVFQIACLCNTFRNGMTKGRSGKLVASCSLEWNSSMVRVEFCRERGKKTRMNTCGKHYVIILLIGGKTISCWRLNDLKTVMGGIWMAVVKGLIWGSLIWWLLHVHALTASSLHQQTQIRRQTQLQMQYYTMQLALRDKTWHNIITHTEDMQL